MADLRSQRALRKVRFRSGPNGELELSHAPDFVGVSSDGKVVGYAPRAYIIGSSKGPLDEKLGSVAPVYGSNLTTEVGHLYPGIGYVPNGVSPTTVSAPGL